MKKAISILLAAALTAAALTGCSKSSGSASSGNTPLVLNEVAHSIFYAPQYAAIELGYFEDEGIDLTLVNGAGADKVMTALISGDAQIGFYGFRGQHLRIPGGFSGLCCELRPADTAGRQLPGGTSA